MSRRKNTSRAKLKAACEEGRHLKRKEHFNNLLRNPSEITDKPIEKFINGQLDIKPRQLMEEELDAVKKKIKSGKTTGLNKIHFEVWKTRKFDDMLLSCYAV